VTITEAKRLELHQDLRNTIGVEAADTLMEHLPPTGWADVVRRSDLDNQTAVTAGEFALVRSEMAAEFAAVRNEMATEFAAVRNEMAAEFTAVRNEMKSEFAAVRNEMATEFAAVRNEMKSEFAAVRNEMKSLGDALRIHIEERLNSQTRWVVGIISANTLAIVAMIVTLVLKL